MQSNETLDQLQVRMQSATEELTTEVMIKKEKILFEKIIERVVRQGLVERPFILQDEFKRRFPRILRVTHPDSECYYWNDGTPEGILLVTFIEDKEITTEPPFTITVKIKYK